MERGAEIGRGNCCALRCMRTAALSMGSRVIGRHIMAELLHDIDFRRPAAILWQEPEGRPETLAIGKFRTDFEISILLREGIMRRQHAGCIFISVDLALDLGGSILRCDIQHAILDDPGFYGRCGSVSVIDIPLLFAIAGKRRPVWLAPPIIGIPCPSCIAHKIERVEFIGECHRRRAGEIVRIDCQDWLSSDVFR